MERRLTVGELAAAVGANATGDESVVVGDIQYDSRLVTPGALFACLRGGYADGHDFAPQAVERGASALLVEQQLPLDVPQILVGNTRRDLASVAAAFFAHPSTAMTVIGITGTDGKTTTSYIADHLLRAAGMQTGVIGTVSVRIADEVVDHETRQTTPESLDIQRYLRQMADAGVTHAVLEATSHGLDLHRLDHVRFSLGAVTNITHEHLEHHKTVQAYRQAKAILFRRVGEAEGIAVINLDDEGAREMLPASRGSRVVTYSLSDPTADFLATRTEISPTGTAFTLVADGESIDVGLPLVGEFNVANALCAAAIVRSIGIPIAAVAEALSTVPQIPGRMQRVDAGQPFSVIVDYAHTPESIEKMLRLLRRQSPGGRLIAVFGSAGERDVPKRALQGAVAARFADAAIFTNEDPRFEDEEQIIAQIAEGARAEGWREGEHFWCIPDRRTAIQRAVAMAHEGDSVLLAGKGHERSIIVGSAKLPWDEAAVARELLSDVVGMPS